jgi:hypothetical protein
VGYTSKTEHKTAATYGDAMVITSPESQRIVDNYVKYMRPIYANEKSGDALFINSQGSPCGANLGMCIYIYIHTYTYIHTYIHINDDVYAYECI